MKRALLASIAALSVLSASAAHASDTIVWKCGDIILSFEHMSSDVNNWVLSGKLPRRRLEIQFADHGKVITLNNKSCRDMTNLDENRK